MDATENDGRGRLGVVTAVVDVEEFNRRKNARLVNKHEFTITMVEMLRDYLGEKPLKSFS